MVSLSTSAGPDRLALLQDFQARGGDRPHAGRLDGARRPVLALLAENVHGDVRWLGEVEGLGAVAHHRAGDRLAVGQGGHPVLSPAASRTRIWRWLKSTSLTRSLVHSTGEKLTDFLLIPFQRIAFVVIEDKALGPVDVGLLGAVGIVLALSCTSLCGQARATAREPNCIPSGSSGQARTWSSSFLGSCVTTNLRKSESAQGTEL
jgi:hypothetical protein